MQAFQLLPVIPNLDAKISSVAIHGPTDDTKKLLIGTDEGSVMAYSIKFEERSNTFLPSLEIIKTLGHGKKPVSDILIFSDLGLVLTLCDGFLDVWNAISLDLTVAVPQNRGVSRFCVYGGPELTYLVAVQQRKKLSLYEYTGRFQLLKEINLPDQATDLVWVGDFIFAAIKKEYIVINIQTNHISSLATFETEPLIRQLSKSEVLCKRDKQALIYNATGGGSDPNKPVPLTRTISWTSFSSSMAVHFPYILSLEADEIEVESTLTWKHQQSLATAAQQLRAFAEGTADQYLIAFSKKAVYSLRATPFPQQAEQIVRAGYIDDGIAFARSTCSQRSDYKEILNALHQVAGFKKLRALEFAKAFPLLTKAQYSPHKVIAEIFPTLLPIPPPAGSEGENFIVSLIKKAKPSIAQDELEKLVHEAKVAAVDFLIDARGTKPWAQDRALLQEILVALYKLFIDVQPHDLDKLLRSFPEDLVPFELLEKFSTDTQHWHALACLYRQAKLPRKALDIWSQYGRLSPPFPPSPSVITLGSGAKKDGESNGLEDSVRLLSETSDVELITDFAPWIYKKDRAKFKEIFTSNTRKTILPLNQVLTFLTQYGRVMQEAYLEWLVLERKYTDDKTESALAWHYLDTVLTLVSSSQKEKDASGVSTASLALLQQARAKLLHFLQSHSQYTANALLARIQPLPLHNEKIVLYQKIGQHEKSLQIMVEDLRDFVRAEQYCLDQSKLSAMGSEDQNDPLFFALFVTYLQIESKDPVPKKALEMINKYPGKFNPIRVLQVLGSDLPLSLLMGYLPKALRHGLHQYRQGQVVKNLEKSQNLQARSMKTSINRKSILITKDILCPLCKKPMGGKVFVHYPNGLVIHFACYQALPPTGDPDMRKHICPITGQNFLTDPL